MLMAQKEREDLEGIKKERKKKARVKPF